MQLVIVTGMSGAGKTIALKTMEDMGYYSADNMPVQLIPKFIEILKDTENRSYSNIAIGADIRSGEHLSELKGILEKLRTGTMAQWLKLKVVFLDASDEALLRRFKETRRAHPLAADGHVEDGLKKERKLLKWLKDCSDIVIDTSMLRTRDLRQQLEAIFAEERPYKNLYLTILSFGYKYGIPKDADIVLDVRFLPNPFYVEGMRELTGLDEKVRDYVLDGEDADEFKERLFGLIDFLIPRYIDEGKNQLVIAFGCTGGKHRSVTVAELTYAHLKEHADYGLRIEHRDIYKK